MLGRGKSYRNPLYLIAWLTDFGGMPIVFTVSRDLAETGASLLTMGAVGAGVSFCQAAGSIVFGRLSDRVGRQIPVFGGTVLLLCAAPGSLLLKPYTALYFAAYSATGMALGMVFVPETAGAGVPAECRKGHWVWVRRRVPFAGDRSERTPAREPPIL